MSTIEIVGIILGALAAIGLVVGFVHAQGLTVLRNDFASAKAEIMSALHLTHQAASSPTAVVVLPAPSAPEKLAAPARIPVGPAGADGKPTFVFPGNQGDAAGLASFNASVHAQTGDFNYTIVNAAGQPLDVRANPIGTDPATDETKLELGTSFGVHPRVDLAVGGSATKNFGPFPVDTKLTVQTVEFSGGSAVGLDVLDPSGTVLGSMNGVAAGNAEVTVVAKAGVVYGARIRNLNAGPTSVHVGLLKA